MLDIQHLTRRYQNKLAVSDLSLTFETGKTYALLGPNGSGKTTLIKMINGLLKPTRGEVLIDGNRPGVESKKIISYLPDSNYLDPDMTFQSSVSLFKDFYEDFEEERAYDMLSRLGIDPKARFKTLSKGNKEKMQLILTMSRQAKLYVLDEPIAGVDPATRDYILQTIIGNYNPQASIIISTHLISDVEKILDDVLFLKNGQIVLYNSADAVRDANGKSVDEVFREVFACSAN